MKTRLTLTTLTTVIKIMKVVKMRQMKSMMKIGNMNTVVKVSVNIVYSKMVQKLGTSGQDSGEDDEIKTIEHGSSAGECMPRNRKIPSSNPPCYRFKVWAFLFSTRRPSSPSCIWL